MSSKSLDSILRMPNIESFPDNELLWLMNLFAHADGFLNCRPYKARLEARRQRVIDGTRAQKRRFEACWFDNPYEFRDALVKRERIFQCTYHAVDLSVARRGQERETDSTARIVADSTWLGCSFMLHRIINLVITIDSATDLEKWIMIRNAIEEQITMLPALERLVVVEHCRPGDVVSEEMSRFLVFALRDVVQARGLRFEVHSLVGRRPAAEG